MNWTPLRQTRKQTVNFLLPLPSNSLYSLDSFFSRSLSSVRHTGPDVTQSKGGALSVSLCSA